jgi:hypothetical protein
MRAESERFFTMFTKCDAEAHQHETRAIALEREVEELELATVTLRSRLDPMGISAALAQYNDNCYLCMQVLSCPILLHPFLIRCLQKLSGAMSQLPIQWQPCGHLVCADCAESLMMDAAKKAQPLKCGLCKKPVDTEKIGYFTPKPSFLARIIKGGGEKEKK